MNKITPIIGLSLFLPLFLTAQSEWTTVKPFRVDTEYEFSRIPGDNTVVSAYSITILRKEIPLPLSQISAFKVEIILESGFSITRVLKNWETGEFSLPTDTTSTEGEKLLETVILTVDIRGWDYWEFDIFAVNVWYKSSAKRDRKKI